MPSARCSDKLPVMAEIPTMTVWGGRDRLIPVQHGRQAHRAIPNSRLEIFPKAGHFLHLDEPRRFAGLLVDFVGQTEDRLVQTAVPPSTDRRGPRLGGDVSARTSGIDALAWPALTRVGHGTTPPDGHRAGSASAAGRTEQPPSSATSVVPGWAHSPAARPAARGSGSMLGRRSVGAAAGGGLSRSAAGGTRARFRPRPC